MDARTEVRDLLATQVLEQWRNEIAIRQLEQYLDFALRLADRFVVLDAGAVVRSGDRTDLADPELLQTLAV